jgi:uncharacterized membrane protein
MFGRKISSMDEMEKVIALKSMRCGFTFTTIALATWIILGIFTRSAWQLPCYILCIQNVVCFIASQLYRKQVDDDDWKKDTVTFISVFMIILLVAMAIPLFFVGK